MLIGKFKSNNPSILVLLFILAILLWIDGFVFNKEAIAEFSDMSPIFSLLDQFRSNHPLVSVIIGFIILFIQAIFFNIIITTNHLTGKTSYLPALIYLVFMSSSFSLLNFQPILLANLVLIGVLYKLFECTEGENITVAMFNIGFLISLASFFYLPVLWFIILPLISIVLIFRFTLRGAIATIIGLSTPYFLLAVCLYWLNNLELGFGVFGRAFKPIDLGAIVLNGFDLIVTIIFAAISLTIFINIFFNNRQGNTVRAQKRLDILLIFLFISIFTVLFSGELIQIHYGILMVPLAAFYAVFFQQQKGKLFNEILFTIILILIAAGKLARVM